MGKIIFWLVVIFVVLFGLRLMNAGKAKRRAREAGEAGRTAETMVRCAKCGVFLPRGEAQPVAGGYICGTPGCAARR
jgi:uncharacterized protein